MLRKSTTRPSAKVEQNRQRIIDAATRLFGERGYHGCSLDEVAGQLGASKQVVYYQFADKADLLAAISGRGAELTLAALAEAQHLEGTVTERLRSFVLRHAQIVIQHGPAISVYIREANNLREEDRRRIINMRAAVDRGIATLIQQGVDTGEFKVDDSLVAARAVTGMISYMCFWARQTSHAGDLELSDQMARLALRVLQGAPDTPFSGA